MEMGWGNCVTVLGTQRGLHIKVISELERLLMRWDEENFAEENVCKAIAAF